MPSKRDILLDSIRKLLSLNVSDMEIILNLGDVGVGEEEAKQLIEEAKNPVAATAQNTSVSKAEQIVNEIEEEKRQRETIQQSSEKPQAEETFVVKETRQEEAEEPLPAEEIAADLAAAEYPEEEQPQPKPVSEIKKIKTESQKLKPLTNSSVPQIAEMKTPSDKQVFPTKQAFSAEKIETVDLSKLWEKGILTTVNSRLAEMKKIRTELDAVLDKKVAAAAKREEEKIRVLLDSQRMLLVSKVDAELEEKANQLMSMIEAKMREMKGISEKIEANLNRIKEEKQDCVQVVQQAMKSLAELQKTKQSLVAEMNSELIKAKSEAQQFFSEAREKMEEIDERVNKTLQLENEVVEGLIRDAELRIAKKIENGSFTTKAGVSLEEIKETKAALEAQIREKLAKLDKVYESAVKLSSQQQKLLQQMAELEEFKKQFVKAIEFNVEKFNKAIKQLNEAGAKEEEQINLRIQKIDRKIAELDAFEKNFAKEMGLALSALTEKKKS